MPAGFPPPTRRQLQRGYVSNDTPANLLKLQIKIDRLMRATETTGAINIFGDSHPLGVGGDYYRNSMGARWAANYRTRFGIAVSDNKFGIYSTAAVTIAYDSRVSVSNTAHWSGWQALPGGQAWRTTTAGAWWKYSDPVACNTATLKWFRDTSGNGGGGNMIITVDGGATQFSTTSPSSGGLVSTFTYSQSGAASIQDLVITIASLGVHTIEVTNDVTGNIQVYGCECYNSAVPTLFIRTLGFSGYTTTNYVANNIPTRMYDVALTAHLNALCVGANDAFTGIAPATTATNVGTMLTSMTILGTASVMGMTFPPASAATAAYATQKLTVDAFVTAMGSGAVIHDQYQRIVDQGGQEVMALARDRKSVV